MSKPILIHAASHAEAEHLISSMLNTCMTTVGGWNYYDGKFGGVSVIVYESGDGMVNAASATTVAVAYFGSGAVITQGTARKIAGEAKHGDLFIAQSAVNAGSSAHSDFSPKDISLAQSGMLLQQKEIKAEERLAEVTGRAPYEGDTHIGTIASTDSELTEEEASALAKAFNAEALDRESAAVFQTAKTFAVPCIGAKLIYDHEDPDALEKFSQYIYLLARRVARAGYGIDFNVNDLLNVNADKNDAE